MPLAGVNLSDLDTGLAQLIDIILGCKTVGDNPVNRRRRRDERETSTAKFAGIANRHDDSSNIHHGAIYFCFQKIRRGQATLDVEAIDTQEKNVGIQATQCFFRNWPNQRKRILPQSSSRQNYLQSRAG